MMPSVIMAGGSEAGLWSMSRAGHLKQLLSLYVLCKTTPQQTAELKNEGRTEWKLHMELYQPWTNNDSVDQGEGYQGKRVTVKPGAKLSVQMHRRADHWIVVVDSADVTKGGSMFLLSENHSTYLPIGVVNAEQNLGKVPLEIIEMQSGFSLGEDYMVRFPDKYGRVNSFA